MPKTPAPYLKPDECVVLFDGVCKLCNGVVKFLIRHDPERRLRLAAVQSEEGQTLLRWAGLPLDDFHTIAVIQNDRVYLRSDGFLHIMRLLPAPWPLLSVLRVFPRFLRDWAYNRIARNRYRLFGRYDQCLLPSPDHETRFLGASSSERG
ncbi:MULTISPECIES: thiol-disulfide oxidoreductase DCC family protein [Pseudomonas]|uniref:Thiol-disulfide oxidoreductase DCC family protein n=2 Tax=Pseudomonas TaxID=286 RepID=A0AAU8LJP9_PSESX|nr:thiol-disulfide oxidoreductase DCC family protein [Pseudomonas triticifolii]MBC3957769.1 thiol-disulfide oxidoreductase DCC family protein [Pseudomonas triticifolii]